MAPQQQKDTNLYQTLLAGIVLALMGYIVTDIRDMKLDIKDIKNDLSELKVEVSTKQNKARHEQLPVNEHQYFVKSEGVNIRRRYAIQQ